jgi:hypothetical protein
MIHCAILLRAKKGVKKGSKSANELTRNRKGIEQITIMVTDELDNPLFEVTGVG